MERAEKRIYWVWAEMLSRCRNANHKQFANYGGRGIAVDPRWHTFKEFRDAMGPRPTGGMLERVDNNQGYGPDNCRWATRTEQNSNRRGCIYVTVGQERVTLKEACRRLQLPYRAVVKRLRYRNWPVEQALSVPVGAGKQYRRIPRAA